MYRLCAVVIVLAGCHHAFAPPPSSRQPAVEAPVDDSPALVSAAEEAPAENASFLGVVLSGETADLAPKVDGRIESVLVRPGDRIRRGAVLARLDRRQMRRSVAVARAELQEAEQRLARRVPLAKGEGIISPEELSSTRMQVLDQRSKLNDLEHALAEAEIRAPFDGVVAARFYDPGALTQGGRPILRVISSSVPRVRFAIPEAQASAIKVGGKVSVLIDGVEEPVRAEVESVSPEVDAAARMIFAQARLDVPSLRDELRSGQVAHVEPADDEHTMASAGGPQ